MNRRSLSRAIRPQQTQDFTLLNGKRDVVDGGEVSKGLGQMIDFKHQAKSPSEPLQKKRTCAWNWWSCRGSWPLSATASPREKKTAHGNKYSSAQCTISARGENSGNQVK